MAKKAETKVPETINSVEALQAKISSMREAQKIYHIHPGAGGQNLF